MVRQFLLYHGSFILLHWSNGRTKQWSAK
jgi:hypothetical protein